MSRLTRREFLAASAVVGASFPAVGAEPRVPLIGPDRPVRPAQVVAHRGLVAMAPENTRLAIDACASDFIEWCAIAVRLTKDGQHVVFNDALLDGKTDAKGAVADRSLDELQSLDAGTWFAPRFKAARVLSLGEALALAKGKLNLCLDCKRIDPELLVKEIRTAGMEKQIVAHGTPDVVAKVRKASGGSVPTMTGYTPTADLVAFVKDVAPNAVEIDAVDVTPELCKTFHANGITVQARVLGAKWDTPETWLKMIASGADRLLTAAPERALMTAARKRVPKWPVAVAYHRGANRYAPENTLPAITTAAALGADYVEIDIRTTKDGKFVVMHDSTVNRTTDGKGRVRDLTLEEVRKLDAGAWFGKPFAGTRVPTLDEALTALGDTASVYLDAKDIAPGALLAAIKDHGLFDRHVVYQSAEYCGRLKKLDARVRPLPPLRAVADLEKVAEVKPYGVDANWRILSKEMIAACHEKGIKVFSDALGVNDTVEPYRTAMGWGIDLIQTDHPLRVLRAVELETR
ncbi:glycerophosphodiester phosphodiesterase [Frigoriglobus tundricola]|uniref:Glycerophosphoryl diester phosphodiesterase n=1 Tax=Frigoriglobus tundricola TaxID=2774151 RepID=A0A6M5Z2G6_9BACT|nr:glycerophosphodiester phosphodiesterase family protein [Frigoriglobus tundricola]QJW99916.1 Glycerophosphoryl diester phosphodiesterase [Frigoriglobus tundricola]